MRILFFIFLLNCLNASSLPVIVVTANKYKNHNEWPFVNVYEPSEFFVTGLEAYNLSYVPGVTMISNNGPGGLSYPRIQGAIREQCRMLWGGVATNTDDLSLFPLHTGEVVIKKGVHCAELGNGVIGGAVDIIPFKKLSDLNGEAGFKVGNDRLNSQNIWWRNNSSALCSLEQHFTSTNYGGVNPIVPRYRNKYFMNCSPFLSKQDFFNKISSDNNHGKADLQFGFLRSSTLSSNKNYSPSDYRAKQIMQIYGLNLESADDKKYRPFLKILHNKKNSKFFDAGVTTFNKNSANYNTVKTGICMDYKLLNFASNVETSNQNFKNSSKSYKRNDYSFAQGIHYLKEYFKLKNWARFYKPEHSKTAYAASTSMFVQLDRTEISTHLGNGFRVPSLYERFSEYGSSNLKSEKAKGGSIGVAQKFVFGKLGVNFFRTQSKDMISFINNKYVNYNRSVQKGLELSYEKILGFYTFTSAYTYTESFYKKPFLRMQNIPRNFLTAKLAYDNLEYAFSTGLKYTGHQIQPDYEDYKISVSKGPYTTIFANFGYNVSDNMNINLSLENLLNKYIESPVGYPQPRAQIYAGITIKW